MKKCPNPICNQTLGQNIAVCPACGCRLEPTPDRIDDYTLLETIQETASGILFRARQDKCDRDVMLRLFPPETNFSSEQAQRIDQELFEVSALSVDCMVQHIALRRSVDQKWYRVSEWIETVPWGDLLASRFFQDPRNKKQWIDLFVQIAESMRILHISGRILPHLSLNDLLLFKDVGGRLKVKLDYKLSPIPEDPHQLPAILKHLTGHPDLAAHRPLDNRSDIWTLGRLMVELLVGTDEFDDCQKMVDGIYHRFEPVVLHRKLSGLLRAMVEDDPDRRTASMDSVVEALRGVTDEDIAKWDKFAKDPTRQNRLGKKIRLYTAATACLVLVIVGSLFVYQRWQTRQEMARAADLARQQADISLNHTRKMIQGQKDYFDAAIADQLAKTLVSMKGMLPEQRITMLSEKYGRSVAFVLVAPYLETDGRRKSMGYGTGTAFLVSSDGYLLTNRHVVCPWLSMPRLEEAFEQANAAGNAIGLGYDLYVWFDGDEAFRTVAGLNSNNVEDTFKLSNAYRSDGRSGKKIELKGVMPIPQEVLDRLGGLQDDVAVLRVTPAPEGAVPIPLRSGANGKKIQTGASVFAIGFPHGRQSIMGGKVVSRFTDGTISRVFEKALTTNADLHPGNSGGPVIDLEGFAIGIASAIFVADANSEHRQPQSSMGRILPIERARIFLDSVRMGNPQWKGMPTYTFSQILEKARREALEGNRDAALGTMEALLADNADSELYLWAGILAAKGVDLTDRGAEYFKKSLVMDPENDFTKFLLYRNDLLKGAAVEKRSFRDDLRALDWRDPHELFGFLVRILEDEVDPEKAVLLGDTPEEEVCLQWAAAALYKVKGRGPDRVQCLKTAFTAVEQDSPLSFMIRSEMAEMGVRPPVEERPSQEGEGELSGELADLLNRILSKKTVPRLKQQAPKSRLEMIQKVFESATKGDWQIALESAEECLATPSRESANMLGVGLIRCQLLDLLGKKENAAAALKAYERQILDPWYRKIAGCLSGEIALESIRPESLKSREKSITLATAMGLKAEADGDTARAIELYNDALDTGLTNWLELGLAYARREKVRQSK